jgi:hypothetical protein
VAAKEPRHSARRKGITARFLSSPALVRDLLSSQAVTREGGETMSPDVLWWLGVFLSLGVVAGVALVFDG